MVVRYIKVTFVTIFVLVVGLISTVNIKGANGVDDLDLEWTSSSNSLGSYETATLDTSESKWDTFFYGQIINDDLPMQIDIEFSSVGGVETIILEPNKYIIYHEPGANGAMLTTINVGSILPENEVYRKEYNVQDVGYIILEFYYYTSGIVKDYYDVGYDVGNQQPSNVGVQLPNGVSDTIEFRNGQAYYVQRVKKYTLERDDIIVLVPLNNVDVIRMRLFNGQTDVSDININDYFINNYPHKDFVDNIININTSYRSPQFNTTNIVVAKDRYSNFDELQADLVGTEIYYQLAEPIETLIILGGELQDYYNYGYNNGYKEGVATAYYDGFGGFINPDTNEPYEETTSFPYGQGWNKGFDDGMQSTESDGLWGVLFSALMAPFQVLGIELLPGVTIGMIVAVPLVFGLLAWILSAGKSKK